MEKAFIPDGRWKRKHLYNTFKRDTPMILQGLAGVGNWKMHQVEVMF